jgi:hypothetical protein
LKISSRSRHSRRSMRDTGRFDHSRLHRTSGRHAARWDERRTNFARRHQRESREAIGRRKGPLVPVESSPARHTRGRGSRPSFEQPPGERGASISATARVRARPPLAPDPLRLQGFRGGAEPRLPRFPPRNLKVNEECQRFESISGLCCRIWQCVYRRLECLQGVVGDPRARYSRLRSATVSGSAEGRAVRWLKRCCGLRSARASLIGTPVPGGTA